MKTRSIVYAALVAAIIIVLGLMPPLTLPFIPVPITLQSMGIMLAGSLLGKRDGTLSVSVVAILVLLGLPFLAGGRGGWAVLLGPTGGYFLAWPVAAFIIGYLSELGGHGLNFWWLLGSNILGGILWVNFCGAIYLIFVTAVNLKAALLGSLIFIPGDCLKAILVTFVTLKLKRLRLFN